MAFTLEELEAKIKANPYAREFFDLAASYQKLGRLEDAKKVCEKGLEKFPGNFQARLLLTQILIAEGKFKEAKQNVDKVLMVVPDNISANFLAGDICFSLGDNAAALKFYRVVELFEPGRNDVAEKIAQIEKPEVPAPAEASPAATEKETPVPVMEDVPAVEPPSVVFEENSGEAPAPEMVEEPLMSVDADMEAEAVEEPDAAEPQEAERDEIGSDTLDSLLAESHEPAPGEAEEEVTEEQPSGFEEEPSPLAGEQAPAEELEEPEFAERQTLGPEEEKSEEGERESGLSTMTIAELYEKQGYPEKAVEVYQHILLKEPERKDIRLRIETLKDQILGLTPEGDVIGHDVKSALRRKRIEVLGTWLRKIKEEGNV
ncbi:MAG TPA: tetratricopeptide repeat protein [Acidobacteriota bacterium]|jgi:tetratricopeptide (TPR) repeat protein|nr:tetratricopeptide repeat protein [Acidobacteriota bacterium]HNT18501.1 tetratricopeptide repeat protein [Acidobacteriota bacterium]HPA26653.1 tetratricopeptide repeat protein [Acidobacteriota bacterium]HQO19398.1 tetratricopeptide repeat protein [Acidobacteriota bacterium]HQQ46164.1 tetratricopeptide repeat protein [Acidobacteriota bacterium]